MLEQINIDPYFDVFISVISESNKRKNIRTQRREKAEKEYFIVCRTGVSVQVRNERYLNYLGAKLGSLFVHLAGDLQLAQNPDYLIYALNDVMVQLRI